VYDDGDDDYTNSFVRKMSGVHNSSECTNR